MQHVFNTLIIHSLHSDELKLNANVSLQECHFKETQQLKLNWLFDSALIIISDCCNVLLYESRKGQESNKRH